MLDLIDGLEEYNNIGALFGLDGLEGEELMGELRKRPFLKRQKFINQLVNTTPSKGSRAEFEKHFGDLPQHIREGIREKSLRLADTVIYSIKKVASKTVKMFETQDVKNVGLNALASAKLPKNQALLVSGIIVLAGVPSELTEDKIKSATFGRIEDFPALCTGEFNIKANKKIIVPDTSVKIFRTSNFHNVPMGYYKLANPRMIHDDIQIEATFELGTMEGLDPKTHIYLGLHGTITTP